MICCDNLIHPFQNDPGVSQRQRVIEDLLAGSAEIDGRSMAGLLDYFMQLSTQVNYYDRNLGIGDWRPFFKGSLPFALAAMIRYDREKIQRKFDEYNRLFDKKPNRHSLQLLINFMYHSTARRMNGWHADVKGSELRVEAVIEKLIKDQLKPPVNNFICLVNIAVQKHKVRKLSFDALKGNPAWGLTNNELGSVACFTSHAPTKRKRLIALRNELKGLFPGLLNSIAVAASAAELSMEQSLFPLKEELQKSHQPHLALLFSFLKLFRHLQSDLNKFTRRHLDFFYQDVLQIKPRGAIPDKAHILFEIQKNLDKYRLVKDLAVKDGKDANKAEMFFSLTDELIVNKTTIADVRTLFLNNRTVYNTDYVEGVYMAPDARKADGLRIDFSDDDPKNWPTLGAKYSKYADPEQQFIKPYPNARIGFILASPVLFLNEGKRSIRITLDCELNDDYCKELTKNIKDAVRKNCCEENGQGNAGNATTSNDCIDNEIVHIAACKIHDQVAGELNKKYYYISKSLIQEAIRKGISNDMILRLKGFLLDDEDNKLCYCPVDKYKYDAIVPEQDFTDGTGNGFTAAQVEMLGEIFKPERVFNLSFSGEKEWIVPSEIVTLGVTLSPVFTMTPSTVICQDPPVGYPFTLTMDVILDTDKSPVVGYNKDALKEDFNTQLPLVRIELNDHIKLRYPGNSFLHFLTRSLVRQEPCCLNSPVDIDNQSISLYHFFRNVKLRAAANNATSIEVKVCGLRKFITQYENTVMDVNGPIYPFGPRPTIIDFDAVAPTRPPLANPNLKGPNFYVGSKEIFLKKWEKICVNLNWKDKPSNFNEYYKAYLKRLNYSDCGHPPVLQPEIYGLNECDFEVNVALLENGSWQKELITSTKGNTNVVTLDYNRRLFDDTTCNNICPLPGNKDFTHSFFIEAADFGVNTRFVQMEDEVKKFEVDSKYGFVRFNLQNQDFLHKDYPFVLARQMMAMGKYPDKGVEGAVYYGSGNAVIVFSDTGSKIVTLEGAINTAAGQANTAETAAADVKTEADSIRTLNANDILDANYPPLEGKIDTAIGETQQTSADMAGIVNDLNTIKSNLDIFDFITPPFGRLRDDLSVPIPNEPWTPTIQNISLDYSAKAGITDIDLIHLYPYDGTYKQEETGEFPPLFPVYCDEGNLFIALDGLVPGGNLSMLFQLAEATADSELEPVKVNWHYLENNEWKSLRKGFEVLEDATNELTTSGIVKFAMPANMTKENTILPRNFHWIKASISRNSKLVSETIGLHTQVALAVFTNAEENDKLRLDSPLPASSISKLRDADASVKKVEQPYDSFGGREPEVEKDYYLRVSELLRHKGRAIQKWDYERIALEAFPQVFKAKCINHSYALNAHAYKNDFPAAPGYVLLAVIPDLNRLKAGNSFEPKAPISLLEQIAAYVKKRTSPFVRLRVMNPRYEKVNLCLKVKLYKGRDEIYYKEKLQEDLLTFLAPWAIGEFDKLRFGQCINRSDLLRFLEGLDYLDYIVELKMQHETDTLMSATQQEVCPRTPRSILLGGRIDICIKQDDCEEWEQCYDQQQQPVDCCDHERIPVVDYCKDKIIIN